MTPQGKSIEKLDLTAYANTPVFNTKAVVLQTGVSAPTLRAWERRYQLLSPERANNTYRLYTERDVATICWLKSRVDEGIAISQAIALFRLKSMETAAEELTDEVNPNAASHIEQSAVEYVQHLGGSEEKLTRASLSYGMQITRERLIAAFTQLDEATASAIIGSMMAIYPLDQVCSELITPTMWQIGELWAEGIISISVEHFASNFFRALLTNLLHVTPITTDEPLAIVCCAPGEPHELAPLMLSLFLRLDGLRIVYLGQNMASKDLLQTVQQLTPALLCVSLTMPEHLGGMLDLARSVAALPQPRPVFAFGGQGVARMPDVISRIPGVYLEGDLKKVAAQLRGFVVQQMEINN